MVNHNAVYLQQRARAEQVWRETRRLIGETQRVVDQSRWLIEEAHRRREALGKAIERKPSAPTYP